MRVNSHSPTKALWFKRTGFALIFLSTILFFVMLSVPWMVIDQESKFYLGVALFVLAQISWWAGLGMSGSTALMWIKNKFR